MLERIKHWSGEAVLEWLHLYWQVVWNGFGINRASDGGCGVGLKPITLFRCVSDNCQGNTFFNKCCHARLG